MEKMELVPIALKGLDKCAIIFRKDAVSFLYVCYHCGASFSDIDNTLQHIETHFRLVQLAVDDNHLRSECTNSKNSTNVNLRINNIDNVTDTADPEIVFKIEENPTNIDLRTNNIDNVTATADPEIVIKTEENPTNIDLCTNTHRNPTDTADPEIVIKTEMMESEYDCGDDSLDASLDADNIICDITDLDFGIKTEIIEDEEESTGRSTPNELIESASFAGQEILPATSKERYDKMYSEFKKWQTSKKAKSISRTVLMAFFKELSQTHKPTTLCAYYSMLKATIKINDKIDIGSYSELNAFLKTKASGYKPVKAKVFGVAEIQKFIDEAPDELWLDVKVVCIFGIKGSCRAYEMPRITMTDIENHGDLLLVRIRKANSSIIDRSFTITGKYRTIVQKYASLRNPDMTDNRFFLNYQRGKCTKQVIGKNKFACMPRKIATYLQLPNPERFTGLSFRKTSATYGFQHGHR